MKADLRDYAVRFKLLAGPSRLDILQILLEGPSNVGQICDRLKLKLKLPVLSYHLGLLRMGGLVTSTRKGRQIIYVADKDVLKGLAAYVAGLASKK